MINSLINSINDLEEVKKFKRYEKIIEDNESYKEMMSSLYECQKQMVNAKHNNLTNAYIEYSNKYKELKKNIEDDIVVSMYLDSLEEVNILLDDITNIISNIVNSKL